MTPLLLTLLAKTEPQEQANVLRVNSIAIASAFGPFRWNGPEKPYERTYAGVIASPATVKLWFAARLEGVLVLFLAEGSISAAAGNKGILQMPIVAKAFKRENQPIANYDAQEVGTSVHKLVAWCTRGTVTLQWTLAKSTCRIPKPLTPTGKKETRALLPVRLDRPGTFALSTHVTESTRYICQPGDHSGDSWHIAAALLLDRTTRVVVSTTAQQQVLDTVRWLELVDLSEPRGSNLEIVDCVVESSAGKYRPGPWEGRDWAPYQGEITLSLRAVVSRLDGVRNVTVTNELGYVSSFPDPLQAVVTQWTVAGKIRFRPPESAGFSRTVVLSAIDKRRKRYVDQNWGAAEPADPGEVSGEVELSMQTWAVDLDLTPEGTDAKFNNKLNQFCRFYADIGIAPERVVLTRTLDAQKLEQRKWTNSFRRCAVAASEDAGSGDPFYGMTWSSTSALMAAIERDGVRHVQGILRDAFVRGLSERDKAQVEKKVEELRGPRRFLLVNMRYATHNAAHNITPEIYDQIRKAARNEIITLVRIGVSDPKSQQSHSQWMNALQDGFAIDIYGAKNRPPGAPVEVDQRRTAYFWRRVAELPNVVGVIGGRSGSLDAAAFMGVRAFSWDIIRRQNIEEQTEYARLWMAYPLMSIGNRTDHEIDPQALVLWLRGFHVIPAEDPPPRPFAPVLRVSSSQKNVNPPAAYRLLLRPVAHVSKAGVVDEVPRLQLSSEWSRHTEPWWIEKMPGDSNCFFHVLAQAVGETMQETRRRLAAYLVDQVYGVELQAMTNLVLSNPGSIGTVPVRDSARSIELRNRYAQTLRAFPRDFPAQFAQFAVYTQYTAEQVETLRKQTSVPGRPNISIWGDDTTMVYAAAHCYGRTMRVYAVGQDGPILASSVDGAGNPVDFVYNDLHFDAIRFNVDPTQFAPRQDATMQI